MTYVTAPTQARRDQDGFAPLPRPGLSRYLGGSLQEDFTPSGGRPSPEGGRAVWAWPHPAAGSAGSGLSLRTETGPCQIDSQIQDMSSRVEYVLRVCGHCHHLFGASCSDLTVPAVLHAWEGFVRALLLRIMISVESLHFLLALLYLDSICFNAGCFSNVLIILWKLWLLALSFTLCKLICFKVY